MIIYIKVKDIGNCLHLIDKKTYDDFIALFNEKMIKKDEEFTVIDRTKVRFKSTIKKMRPKNSNAIRQWALVNDINGNRCLVYKNRLAKLVQRSGPFEEIEVVDINNKIRIINPEFCILK